MILRYEEAIEMGNIKRLPENAVKLIAAGEVILGPYSVVKELIENSLDAGSKNIWISLKGNGIKEILVRDDGEGMDREDALKAFERYSTSKIKEARDILRLRTYGFRGEALPSIASVSLTTLSTSNGKEGTRVKAKGGKIVEVEEINLPRGTQVKVEELFFNTPVRRRSLRSPHWELKQILEVVVRESLSSLKVSYYVENNGKEVFYSPPRDKVIERIQDIWGKEWRKNLLPVDFSWKGIDIVGWCSSPSIGKKSPVYYFYINNRSITHKVLKGAVRKAYSTYLGKDEFPVVYLFLNVAPHQIDVNVHPSKEEVQFKQPGIVFEAVKKALQNSFPQKTSQVFSSPSLISKDSTTGKEREKSLLEFSFDVREKGKEYQVIPFTQMHRTYLFREIKEGILVIDQHALHERLIFEEWKKEIKRRRILKQKLLFPVTVEVSPQEESVIKENWQSITEIGVELEEFGSRTYLLSSLPSLIAGKTDPLRTFSDILDEIKEIPASIPLPERIEALIKRLSCRAAIKGGEILKEEEVENLLKMWEENRKIVTCPHGRPVFIIITWEELEKRFQRR